MWRCLLISLTAVLAQGAKPAGPSEFYIVSESFSDNGAAFYYRVLEVKQDGSDSLVRYIRVAPLAAFCRHELVQAVETRIRGTSPAELVKNDNPCAVKPKALNAAVKKYSRRAGVFETISFGIVAQCESESITLGLPIYEAIKQDQMERAHPEMLRLWDLASHIVKAAFGSKDIFHASTEEEGARLQQTGEKLVPELISGGYDAGLAAAAKGNVGSWDSPSFRSLLHDYTGPVRIQPLSAQLLNAHEYRFSNYTAPTYPPLALQARIQGKIELQITVDQASGEVRNVSVMSGHPLLTSTAIGAVKQWRFEPNSAGSNMVRVTLDFALHCP